MTITAKARQFYNLIAPPEGVSDKRWIWFGAH